MKDLVMETTFDCNKGGMQMQAMDSSHVSLCTLQLKAEGFEEYRCDRNVALGISLTNLAKILKCAQNDDSITMKAQDDSDTCTFVFNSAKNDRISEFEFKLMQIDGEQLGVPDTKYDCTVKMSSREFRSIVSDLSSLGDTCELSVSKEGIIFSVKGDMGIATITVKQKQNIDEKEGGGCQIDMAQPVKLQFAFRYLQNFTKATPLADRVVLHLSPDNPLMVDYQMQGVGDVRYFLAPKLDEEGA
jgi:proliferating cell nuclear antigen